MPAYLTRMPSGIPGHVSVVDGATIEQQLMDTTGIPGAFGDFVKIVAGRVRGIAASDTAAVIYGLLVRSFPTQSPTDGLGAAAPVAGRMCDVLRRGYVNVRLQAGTAAKNGAVHVRVVAGSGRLVGAIEAAQDGVNTVLVAGCVFTGPADAAGNVEIAFNI